MTFMLKVSKYGPDFSFPCATAPAPPVMVLFSPYLLWSSFFFSSSSTKGVRGRYSKRKRSSLFKMTLVGFESESLFAPPMFPPYKYICAYSPCMLRICSRSLILRSCPMSYLSAYTEHEQCTGITRSCMHPLSTTAILKRHCLLHSFKVNRRPFSLPYEACTAFSGKR
jgi:hypothetical protein